MKTQTRVASSINLHKSVKIGKIQSAVKKNPTTTESEIAIPRIVFLLWSNYVKVVVMDIRCICYQRSYVNRNLLFVCGGGLAF